MIGTVVRHWFYLLWESPFSALIANLVLIFLLGFGFGVVAVLPLPAPVLIGLGLFSLAAAILYTAGLGGLAHRISRQESWGLSTPWTLIPRQLGAAVLGFLSFLFLWTMWGISIPSYLATPDHIPPSDPEFLSVLADGDRIRLNWRDPLDADLGAIRLEITLHERNKRFEGRIDPGQGTYLVPEFEGAADFVLRALDASGNASEGVVVQVAGGTWSAHRLREGRSRATPRLSVGGISTDGLNLSWDRDESAEPLDGSGTFRLVAAETLDALPSPTSGAHPASQILLDWSEGVLRLCLAGVGLERTRWYQAQARWPDGTVSVSQPLRVTTLGVGNLVVAGILVVLFVWLAISLPFWFPWKRQHHEGWWTSLRRSQLYLVTHLGFALWASLGALIWVLLSALLLTVFPGLLGIALWYEESLRMQLELDRWLAEHPDRAAGPLPWGQIFARERQLWANRRLRQWLMPWR